MRECPQVFDIGSERRFAKDDLCVLKACVVSRMVRWDLVPM